MEDKQESENKCLLCWIAKEVPTISGVEAAAFVLAESIKFPDIHLCRYEQLCKEHAQLAHQAVKVSQG